MVSRYFRHAPGVSCMLGPMEAVPKARKQAQRIQRKPVSKAVAPKVLEAEDAEAQVDRYTPRRGCLPTLRQIAVRFLFVVLHLPEEKLCASVRA